MRLQKIVSIMTFGLLLASTLPSTVQADWELVKDEDGVQVYTQSVPGSGIKEFKGVTQMRASEFPSTSIAFAALRTSIRMASMSIRAFAIVSTFLPRLAMGLPNASRDKPRFAIISMARSAAPIDRMQ